ncbi:hypothetical protein AB44_3651 [Escherichia coli 3-073-06_S1_C2]|nr:hypothetical protein AB44_3651 [Escherichia coli 3-073-06_S1_C2]
MNMMISYQELVRTFPNAIQADNRVFLCIINPSGEYKESRMH